MIGKVGDQEVIRIGNDGKAYIAKKSELEDVIQPNVDKIEGDGSGTSKGVVKSQHNQNVNSIDKNGAEIKANIQKKNEL